jgi:C1A family cysteine protease
MLARAKQLHFKTYRPYSHGAATKAGETHKGHTVLVCGYDDTKHALIIRNSWDEDWGEEGYGYHPYPFYREVNNKSEVLAELKSLKFQSKKISREYWLLAREADFQQQTITMYKAMQGPRNSSQT